MTERTFASWVEPVATTLADGRRQVLEFAKVAPADLWNGPTEADGWTCKDVVAHLAGGNDRLLQTVLRAVTASEQLDPALLRIDTDAENAAGVDERRNWPVDELIAALERDGEEVQNLLSKLTEENKDVRQDGFPMSLGQFLELVREERHDLEHRAQLRTALEAQGIG